MTSVLIGYGTCHSFVPLLRDPHAIAYVRGPSDICDSKMLLNVRTSSRASLAPTGGIRSVGICRAAHPHVGASKPAPTKCHAKTITYNTNRETEVFSSCARRSSDCTLLLACPTDSAVASTILEIRSIFSATLALARLCSVVEVATSRT